MSAIENKLQAPVLFLIFNKPETTKSVFEAIRAARPTKLFIGADGPRVNRADDIIKCQEVRKIVAAVDWECEVHTRLRDVNLGCGKAPADSITWFFENVEEGIILEDDCLPTPEFFPYCAALLERYRHDTRVMQIGGVKWVEDNLDDASYFFSRFCNTWGWATWRRAWKLYDYEIKSYGTLRTDRHFKYCFSSLLHFDHLKGVFDRTYGNTENTDWWDYQWEYCMRVNSGLAIWPNKNMIVNVGLGKDATHTTDPNGFGSHLKWEKMSFPLIHPNLVVPSIDADATYFKSYHTSWKWWLKHHIKAVIDREHLYR